MADFQPSPLVSVVLPTLNGSRYIAASIGSVLAQTYTNLELIVVDGGSTDGTLEIVAGVADARLKLVRQSDDADRLPGALNDGFALATGTYFTWAQDDDLFAPEALAVMVRALDQRADVGLVYTGFQFIDENGAVIRAATLGPPEGLAASNVVGHCFLYRRTLAEQVGRYDPNFIMSEDTHFWLRAYRCGRLLHLPGSYYFHRLHPDSLTVRDYGRYQALRVAARARREVLGISRLAYARQVSSAYIEEAFAAYAAGDLRRVRRCLAPALLRNPTWLRNRGVWSIGLRSLVARTPPRRRGRSASS